MKINSYLLTAILGIMSWLAVNLWQTRENEMERMREDIKSIKSEVTGLNMDRAYLKAKGVL